MCEPLPITRSINISLWFEHNTDPSLCNICTLADPYITLMSGHAISHMIDGLRDASAL